MVTTLRGHTGLVKGLTWDPVGKYIASQADDHSLKVWRTVDWQLEANITKPFNEVEELALSSDWNLLYYVFPTVSDFPSLAVPVRGDDPRPAPVLVPRRAVPGVGSRHEQLWPHRSDRREGRLEDEHGFCGPS